MAIIYIISIFMDTFIIGFHLRPLLFPEVTVWNTCFSALMLIDVFLKFFIQFRSENLLEDDDEDEDEYNKPLGDPSSSKVGAADNRET